MPSESASHDALAGDPRIVGSAAACAGILQTTVLLPLNTIQTRMQHKGLRFTSTFQNIFSRGAFRGAIHLYAAWPPTMAMVGMRQGLIFATGSKLKQHMPAGLPEIARDALSMATSALLCSGFLFPMDTVKTRMQLQMALPRPTELYGGFFPAVSHSIVGRALWMSVRNTLESVVPNPDNQRLVYWKHFMCGGVTGVLVTVTVFPLDTLKKRLQAPVDMKKHTVTGEAQALFVEGGILRFYRGAEVKLFMNFMQGACFNLCFVVCRRALESVFT